MEQFDRLISLIGKENYNKIKNTKILIIGLGGVGGYATLSLVRSGVESITIVDYDVIDISNLNRQIITNFENIGYKKTTVTKEEILKINPNCKIKIIDKYLTEENYELIFEETPDYLIDACDTIKVKEKIIEYCLHHDIKFISCMGTGKKLDPSQLEIADIRNTSYDPLAKKIRKYVKDKKLKGKIPVVFSKEQPKYTDNVIGSFCPVVATAGLLCSSYVINEIINLNNKEKNN